MNECITVLINPASTPLLCSSHLQPARSLPHPALLQLGVVDDAVELGHLVLQLLRSPAEPLGLLAEPAGLALGRSLGCLHLGLLLDGRGAALQTGADIRLQHRKHRKLASFVSGETERNNILPIPLTLDNKRQMAELQSELSLGCAD